MFILEFSKVSPNARKYFLTKLASIELVEFNCSLKVWTFKKEHLRSIEQWIFVIDEPVVIIEVK
ncbi:MAG: hypothetical protein LRY73_17960 [Bacillus sp. (in: Bacteria)]|nr:hypothetical protein [Bacillus sp. (in: firmicutes)]